MQELQAKIRELEPWFHNLDLRGVRTAPHHPLGNFLNELWAVVEPAFPADMTGATVLDIGCNAGFYSLKLHGRAPRSRDRARPALPRPGSPAEGGDLWRRSASQPSLDISLQIFRRAPAPAFSSARRGRATHRVDPGRGRGRRRPHHRRCRVPSEVLVARGLGSAGRVVHPVGRRSWNH